MRYTETRERQRAMDLECYPGYFLVKFRDMHGLCLEHEYPMYPGRDLDVLAIMDIIRDSTVYTFNGNNYDIPMLTLALTGVDTYAMKQANDAIIVQGLKPWDFRKAYDVRTPWELDHVDLMEVAPGVGVSLKLYAGRGHSRKMQDLPIDPSKTITPLERVGIAVYCGNDLEVTCDLKAAVQERLDLRATLSKQYGVDLRSKSDAQIAEAVIKAKLSFEPERRVVPHGFTFYYQPPACIRFITPELQAAFQTVCAAPFVVTDKEQARNMYVQESDDPRSDVYDNDGKKVSTGVKLPPTIRALDIRIGTSVYQMGIGGLHSTESHVHYYTVPGVRSISDHDVKSYYPSLILAQGMSPSQLRDEFLPIYKEIYDRRLFAKGEAARLKRLLKEPLNHVREILAGLMRAVAEAGTEEGGLKIVLNGTFGKLFSKYSILFAPELGIQVTLTGQLYLLMLIEQLEFQGISVLSANTDGIVVSTPAGMEAIRDEIIKQWERITQLEMDATFYRGIFMRDVNNYVAIKMDGSHKARGVFGPSGIVNNKHPDREICSDAVIAYLTKGTPIEQTIHACNDVRKLVVIQKVKGGARYYPRRYPEVEEAKHRDTRARGRLRNEEKKSIPNHEKLQASRVEALATGLILAQAKMERDNEGFFLGKAVRWYYSTNKTAWIGYNGSGNLVADSSGCMPAMELPTQMPADVDKDYYINYAHRLLAEVGLRVHYEKAPA